MRATLCRHCRQHWPVLQDGTLVEHPQPNNAYFLCAGSRTKPQELEAAEEQPPARELHRHDERRRPTFATN